MKKIFFLLASAVLLAVLVGCGKAPVYVDTHYKGDVSMWNHIFEKGEPLEFDSSPFGVILPHHSIAQFEVNRFYKGLAKVKNPSIVVVLSPNHFEADLEGESNNVQTCEACVYRTTDGNLTVESDIVESMVDKKVAAYDDSAFVKEHGVFAHAPFIKHYFPDAKIVPVIFKWNTPIDELKAVSSFLNENLPADALVVASVDFSHYVPDGMALFHDESSFASITNFDFSNIFDLELDSPSSIYTFLSLMKDRGYMKASLKNHTNLTDFIEEHQEETTSHLYFAFYKGDIEPYKGVGILAVGNLPEGHSFDFLTSRRWEENSEVKTDRTTDSLLRDIRGTEDRFLVGTDFYLFDHADNACSIEEQNNMKIAFCKFLEDKDSEKKYLKMIADIKKEADEVVLLFEYQGGGTVDSSRKFFTRALAKKGVDIFIGRGLDDVVPFETYRGNLLFHNLGDFVLDNKLVTDLNAISSGMILGIFITPYEYTVYTFPISVKNGYPVLEDYSKRTVLFDVYKEDAMLDRHDSFNKDKGFIKIDR